MSKSAADLAAVLREALDGISSFADDVGFAQAALDALVARCEELQAFKNEALQTDWIARAEAAEKERDEAREEQEFYEKECQAMRREVDVAQRELLVHLRWGLRNG